ncbi:MAG: transglycosylase domain-containing protein [Thermoanaerobaculia bacterium]
MQRLLTMFANADPRIRRHRLLALLALPPGLILFGLAGYVLYLNHRVSQELVGASWKTPTEIYSTAVSSKDPVIRVYGPDWHTTKPVLVDELPDHVENAFIAAEDVRFRRHIGVDPIGIVRAMFTNLRAGAITQGGSTIHQQLIKSKFLSAERTFRRKFIEMIMAVILELRMSKNEILEAYLNEVYLGHIRGRPVLGIDEAARIYFDKRPERLDVSDAALLASIVRAPNRDTPEKRPDLVRARRDAILETMESKGWIDEQTLARAKRKPLRFNYGTIEESKYRHYISALRTEAAARIPPRALRAGGLKIVCEMNPAMQREAERAATAGARQLLRRYGWLREMARGGPLEVVILSVDPGNGGIRALVGGLDPGSRPIDRTGTMRRQPGSAFKTFTYLAAIESERFTNASLLLDTPLRVALARNDVWEPHNYDERFRGRVTVRESFEKSLNVPTVRLAQEIGPPRIVWTAKKFGFEEDFEAVPAIPLGVEEVTVREMTGAYTAFPTLGVRAEPFLLTEVRTRNGKRLFRQEAQKIRVASEESAYIVHTLLRGVVRRGTAGRLRNYGLRHVAGKTGTTSDYRDAWFVGYTPDLVTTVWVGFDRGAPLRLSSAEAALPIWGTYVSRIDTSEREIKAPEGVEFHEIDPESGLLWREGCPGPVDEVFLAGTAPRQLCPAGFFGRIIRRVLFDDEEFDEPAAITIEQFRQWAEEVERNRREVESTLEKLSRIFGGNERRDRKRD